MRFFAVISFMLHLLVHHAGLLLCAPHVFFFFSLNKDDTCEQEAAILLLKITILKCLPGNTAPLTNPSMCVNAKGERATVNILKLIQK